MYKKTAILLTILICSLTISSSLHAFELALGDEKRIKEEGLIVDTAPDMDRWGDGNRAARQGVPAIERSPCGRLWVAFRTEYSKDQMERSVALVSSDDEGKTWSEPLVVLHDPEKNISPFDPVLWYDPLGRLWFFWSQRPDFDVWAIRADDAGKEDPNWSGSRRLMPGIMMNKPMVSSGNKWLFPASRWGEKVVDAFVSQDEGWSFEYLGAAEMPQDIQYPEHMIIEQNDRCLWMLVRSQEPNGMAEAFSRDNGKTWSKGNMYKEGPNTRFHIRRLQSGRLLLIYHHHSEERINLTAYLSDDEGETWPHRLLLEGGNATYPDAVQAEDGRIYVVYDTRGSDHEPEAEVHMAIFEEEDIIAGEFVTENARSGVLVNNNRPR